MMWPFKTKKKKAAKEEKEMDTNDSAEETVDPKGDTRVIPCSSAKPDEDTAVIQQTHDETKTQLANIKSSLAARQDRIQKMAQQVQKKHETKKVTDK